MQGIVEKKIWPFEMINPFYVKVVSILTRRWKRLYSFRFHKGLLKSTTPTTAFIIINTTNLENLPAKELQQLKKPSKSYSFFFNFRSSLNNNFKIGTESFL